MGPHALCRHLHHQLPPHDRRLAGPALPHLVAGPGVAVLSPLAGGGLGPAQAPAPPRRRAPRRRLGGADGGPRVPLHRRPGHLRLLLAAARLRPHSRRRRGAVAASSPARLGRPRRSRPRRRRQRGADRARPLPALRLGDPARRDRRRHGHHRPAPGPGLETPRPARRDFLRLLPLARADRPRPRPPAARRGGDHRLHAHPPPRLAVVPLCRAAVSPRPSPGPGRGRRRRLGLTIQARRSRAASPLRLC